MKKKAIKNILYGFLLLNIKSQSCKLTLNFIFTAWLFISFPGQCFLFIHRDVRTTQLMTDSLILLLCAKDITKRTQAVQLLWTKCCECQGEKVKVCTSLALGGSIRFLTNRLKLTMILLAQQVFCGWKEHFHEFWNLSDDMNCTQRCL